MGIYVLKNLLFKIVTKIHILHLVFYAYDSDFTHRPPVQKLLAVKAQKHSIGITSRSGSFNLLFASELKLKYLKLNT